MAGQVDKGRTFRFHGQATKGQKKRQNHQDGGGVAKRIDIKASKHVRIWESGPRGHSPNYVWSSRKEIQK